MLNAYFVLTLYYAIYCTVQQHRILLYKYGAIEINKHLHLHFIAVFTPYFFMIRDVVSDNPWTYGSTTMPLLLSFSTVFFMMLSSFFVFIFLCTVDMVHCGYPHLVRVSLMCSLSLLLSSSSDTSVLHLSSNVWITPIFWCNGWCVEKFRYWTVWVFFWKISSFTSRITTVSPSSSSHLKKIADSSRNIMGRKRKTDCEISKNITHLTHPV